MFNFKNVMLNFKPNKHIKSKNPTSGRLFYNNNKIKKHPDYHNKTI